MTNHVLTYSERIPQCKNAFAKKLLALLDNKQSNLALSADVIYSEELLSLADTLGPEICILKTHIDILSDFTPRVTKDLKKLAQKHQFFIFEDRKFADIGHTVELQYEGGIYHIADWADIINAHSLPGPSLIRGLMEKQTAKPRGLLLIAEMSSEENFADPIYAQRTLELAEQFPEYVMGFISQRKLNDDDHWIYMTPGVQMKEGRDHLGQQYISPQKAIGENASDIIIVGRGITETKNPVEEAKKYRKAGWNAYKQSVCV